MSLQLLFWILMILWLLFGFWRGRIAGQPYPLEYAGGHLLNFILFVILGWKVFGSPIQ